MPSSLQVDKIIDSSATTNKELAEYSSSAWSWGSGVPAGSVIQTKFYTFTGGSADIASTTTTAIQNYTSFSCGSGNTIFVSFNFRYHAELTGSGASGRNGFVNVYNSTSSVSSGATSSLGTKLNEYRIGRNLTGSSGSSASSLHAVHAQGVFVSTTTTHYIGLAQKSDSSDVQCRIYRTSDSPLLLSIIEIKGDVLT
tara:strand:+ start:18 stop:608 length:591 start_codon:yes stop_codon:yes gene_type:complete